MSVQGVRGKEYETHTYQYGASRFARCDVGNPNFAKASQPTTERIGESQIGAAVVSYDYAFEAFYNLLL